MVVAAAARGVDVVQERVEAAAADELEPARGHAFGVVARGAERFGERRVVDERDARRGDLFALAPDEHRAALLHRLGRERRADQRDERARDLRVEHDRQAPRCRLRRAEQAAPRARPRRARPRRGRGRRTPGPTEKPPPVCVSSPSPAIANAEHEHTVRRVTTSTPSEFDDRALDRGVAVRRRPQAADAGVDGLGGGFELDRERDLVRRSGTARSSSRHRSSSTACDPGEVVGRRRARRTRRARRSRVVARVGERVGDDVGDRAIPPTRSPAGWSTITRTPTPSISAVDSDSTSPSNTFTSTSRDRTAYASICSPARAAPATRTRELEQVDAAHVLIRRCRRR